MTDSACAEPGRGGVAGKLWCSNLRPGW